MRIAIWATALGLMLASAMASPALEPQQKRVLLLYGSRSDMLGNIVVDRTIRSSLTEQFNVNLDVRSEYFEVQSAGERNYETLLDWLSHKYAGTTFDVVVAIGTEALHFASAYGHDLFPGAATVFWGRIDGLRDWESDEPITGVVAPEMPRHLKATVDLILRLQPDLRSLIVVSGASQVDLRWNAAAQSVLPAYEDRLAVSLISGPTLEDLEIRLSHLPPRTAIVCLSMYEDGAGRRLSSSDVLTKVVQSASAPVYSTSILFIDTGIVGGALVNQETLAAEMARLVARLLRGERIADIPVQEGSTTPTVNWKQLRRWNIPENRIPEGTVVVHKDVSLWDLYKRPIIAIVSFCFLETALIAALLIERASRKRAERSLGESMTELKRAHDAHQQLTGQLLRAQDDERRRIARDLHDVTVQNIATMKADLTRVHAASHLLDARTRERVQGTLAISDQVIKELRTLSYLLHPPLLDELGLIPALQWYVRGFMERSGIQVELCVNGEIGRLPTDLETALFRVAQESLSNIHRHSGSPSAIMCATQDQNAVVLQIKDKGHGISRNRELSHPFVTPPGVGIMGMGERLRQLGGQLDIESSDQGTTVTATVPVRTPTATVTNTGSCPEKSRR